MRVPGRECDELISNVHESHPGALAAERELEDPAQEIEGLVDVVHLDGDVVDPDRFRHRRDASETTPARLRCYNPAPADARSAIFL